MPVLSEWWKWREYVDTRRVSKGERGKGKADGRQVRLMDICMIRLYYRNGYAVSSNKVEWWLVLKEAS